MSVTAAILELRDHRDELRESTFRFASLVAELPEWLTVEQVSLLTGYGRDHLYTLAAELPEEQTRRNGRGKGGAWEIHRDAALRLPVKGGP